MNHQEDWIPRNPCVGFIPGSQGLVHNAPTKSWFSTPLQTTPWKFPENCQPLVRFTAGNLNPTFPSFKRKLHSSMDS